MNKYLDIAAEVSQALKNKQAVVALESTIISHGMPYPQNVETAIKVEEIIRANGAIPATIAVINGRMKAGLDKAEIEKLGKAGLNVAKVSRRDLPQIIADKVDGATTVAATMIIANFAEIRLFATGGIGGIHRGAENTWDVSADLEELANTSVAVVCAGAKSILDLAKTLEYLETKGVPVIGYNTLDFPAFYSQTSGLMLQESAASPTIIASRLLAKWGANLTGGVVIANPIPAEYSIELTEITKIINQALEEAKLAGISGTDTTPYLLAKVKDLTSGESLIANINLVYNNAKLAAQIAVAYCQLNS